MLSWSASSLLNLRPGCSLQKSHAKFFQWSSSVLLFFAVSNSAYRALSVSTWSGRTLMKEEQSIAIIALFLLSSTSLLQCFRFLYNLAE